MGLRGKRAASASRSNGSNGLDCVSTWYRSLHVQRRTGKRLAAASRYCLQLGHVSYRAPHSSGHELMPCVMALFRSCLALPMSRPLWSTASAASA